MERWCKDTGSPRGTGVIPPRQGGWWAWRKGCHERGGRRSQATRAARIYQLQRKEAVGTRCPYCLALSLPPVPARATAGHACALRAQFGCNVRAPCVAHRACLRAARSRALTRLRTCARNRARESECATQEAHGRALRVRSTNTLVRRLPDLCVCLPAALFLSFLPVSAPSLCSVRVR